MAAICVMISARRDYLSIGLRKRLRPGPRKTAGQPHNRQTLAPTIPIDTAFTQP
jgi:hypothetical protein